MKKIKYFGLMGAIALTSAIGFTACSSSDDVAEDVNPTYDGTSVRTDFAFSVASGPMGSTRMTGDIVHQAEGAFTGMTDMYLFPFATASSTTSPTGSTSTNAPFYNLGILANSEINSDQSSKVYALQIPVGTNNFLFYGKANNGGTYAVKGALTFSIASTATAATKNTDDLNFSLQPIASSGLGNDATYLAAYLSNIAKAKYTNASDETINWYDAVGKANNDGHYSTLKTMYEKFTGINDHESRAGSAEGILRTVLDLYVTAKAIVQQAGGSDDVKGVANAICSAITTGTNNIAVDIDETTNTDPKYWTAAWKSDKKPDETFPKNLQLPIGAAQLTYNPTSHTFVYKDEPWYETHDETTGVASTGVNVGKICFPSELIYFDNSPLHATDVYKKVADYPTTVADWDDVAGEFASWTDTEVKTSTRAVAMSNNVNYGVAMLETTVKFKDDLTNLTDNRKGITGEANQTDIPISGVDPISGEDIGFKVTGIIIGGQPGKVGWNMTNPSLPTISGNTNGREVFDNVIYDQSLPDSYANFITTDKNQLGSNYTLVLDNYTTNNNEEQKPVRFALELINNSGKDFYGRYNMIPNGHTFYLCGELNPSSNNTYTKATRGTSDYRVTKEDKARVFVQDYKTIANITINADALQKAYNTIPDLRATEVLFGLSVDLKWETGITFNVEM